MAVPSVPPPADPAVPAPNQPAPAAPQLAHQPALNCSHFRPELAGKPEEDAEAHLLCTNDLMETHDFPEGVKVQRFCILW